MTTRAPRAIASAFTSSAFSPYSSMYFAVTVSGGSLPGRRAGTKPQPTSTAIAAPSRNPRASAPRIRSGLRSAVHAASSSTACLSAAWSSRSGVMSLKPTPGSGKSGTSRMRVLRSITLWATTRRVYARCARGGAPTAPARSRRGPAGPPARPRGARGCASAAPARRPPPAARSRGRPRSGTRAGAAARSRSGPASRRRRRRRCPSRSRRAAPPSRRGSSSPNSSSSRARLRSMPARAQSVSRSISSSVPARERGTAAAALLARPRLQLLADHAQRQELVALQAQDRLQPLHVLLGEVLGFKRLAQFATVCSPWMIVMFVAGALATLPLLGDAQLVGILADRQR